MRRLARLEEPVSLRWRAAWADYHNFEQSHLRFSLPPGDISKEPRHTEIEALKKGTCLPDTKAIEKWFMSYDRACPKALDTFAKAGHLWPHKLPTPPPLPAELRRRLIPMLDSDDSVARHYAGVQLTICAVADAVREWLKLTH